ncbi:hypothetical protein JN531_014800 [Flagellatimonas centrodinii]|uniref:hypothetical protein n=1 Tax=Flagellatimonas centrodinii TaxID=2806210 RepID=UPI001FEF03A2|nr:hypothetical protein [Flagellatimonas centrodinii]ULQ46355.1 hypothetical protein JN531_014800 [Flagellatimonas centrodinii]
MDKNPEKELEALRREFKEKDAARRAELLKSAIATVIVGLVGLFFSFSQLSSLFDSKARKPESLELKALKAELAFVRRQTDEIAKVTEELAAPDPSASITLEQQKLATAVATVDERLQRIEAAIVESPERALSIPLLRKDLDESSRRLEEYREASRAEVGRLYDQQKWMLGGIGTVLLAVIGGAITTIFRSLPKREKNDA